MREIGRNPGGLNNELSSLPRPRADGFKRRKNPVRNVLPGAGKADSLQARAPGAGVACAEALH